MLKVRTDVRRKKNQRRVKRIFDHLHRRKYDYSCVDISVSPTDACQTLHSSGAHYLRHQCFRVARRDDKKLKTQGK